MNAGDRVMVFDSPGEPLPHYLYATVITPSDAGAIVIVDHPGNARHSQQCFVAHDKIMTAAEAVRLRDQAKLDLQNERGSDRRTLLQNQVRHHDHVASQLN
jgi:hypothetical protein